MIYNSHHFERFTVTTMTWLNDHRYVPYVVITIRILPHSSLVRRVTQRVTHVDQVVLARPEHLVLLAFVFLILLEFCVVF